MFPPVPFCNILLTACGTFEDTLCTVAYTHIFYSDDPATGTDIPGV